MFQISTPKIPLPAELQFILVSLIVPPLFYGEKYLVSDLNRSGPPLPCHAELSSERGVVFAAENERERERPRPRPRPPPSPLVFVSAKENTSRSGLD